ncbi:sensor protein FixL [mine drainage metagenome]|uniref:Sensor protein FixL n=1 Tax=mine drainage metagenome TaxID=410659 RepID=A0A1J5SJ87_9ZZZZ
MPPADEPVRKKAQYALRVEVEEQLSPESPVEENSRATWEKLYELQAHLLAPKLQDDERRNTQIGGEVFRDRYMDLYDFFPIGYLTLGSDGIINEVNLAGAALLGVERSKLIRRRFAPFVAPDDSESWHRHFLHTQNSSDRQSCELAIRRLDGSSFQAKLDSMRMEAGNDAPLRIVISDITERKSMEKEIQYRRKEMDDLHMLHATSQTVAAIAHELNQPLLAIASYSSAALMLLESGEPNLDKVRKAIDGCERQAHRAGKSIRDLLEFLNIQEFTTEIFDLHKEIADILDAARSEQELAFECVFHKSEELPLVRASRTHVQKVLLNLLHNGVEAMREAGVPLPVISVTVKRIPDESAVQVTIQDNGPGIREEDVYRLFKPFFTTKAKGIGMGLAVSRSLIETNGGKLWFELQAGAGAIFHLTLPLAS